MRADLLRWPMSWRVPISLDLSLPEAAVVLVCADCTERQANPVCMAMTVQTWFRIDG